MRPCLFAALLLPALFAGVHGAEDGDRTITKVIKLLKGILDRSKADQEKDTSLFAKYICFCDSNIKEKNTAIENYGRKITMLASQIGELQGSNARLSSEAYDLEVKAGENEQARITAQELRDKENVDFKANEEDLIAAIHQMDDAITTLSKVGADGTALVREESEVSSGFMAKGESDSSDTNAPNHKTLKQISGDVKSALEAASALMSGKDRKKTMAFLQAPFTGTYTSASGEIVGILKNMRDTFRANLKAARSTESAAAESHRVFMGVKEEGFATLKSSGEDRQKILAANDEALASKKTAKEDAEAAKANDEDFVSKLVPLCALKKKEYEDRKVVRASEEAAVSQAISILNSDAAFDTLGATKAATEGATGLFLQVGRRSHRVSVRELLAKKLQKQAKAHKSLRLARVAMALESGNPFDKVIGEVEKMKALIMEEEKKDRENKEWCDSERETSHTTRSEKQDEIDGFEGAVAEYSDILDNEETGLRKQLADEKETLARNQEDQATTISERSAENAAYQQNIHNLVEAQDILSKATKTLKEFYEWLQRKQGPHHYEKKEGKDSGSSTIKRIPEASTEDLEKACSEDPNCAGFNSNGILKSAIDPEEKWIDGPGDLYVKTYDALLVQTKAKSGSKAKEDPAPPTDAGEDGVGRADEGNEAVSMLEFILSETAKEEKQAHQDEEDAQKTFEDEMADLKSQEATSNDIIASLTEEANEKAKQLIAAQENLAKSTTEHKAVEAYLLKIKPGCDFITENIELRNEHRAAEISGLDGAEDTLRATPIYKKAAAEAEAAALGECAAKCEDKEQAECKACVAGTSVPGYCSGHPDTPGC